jgi:carbamoyl-phosphate synthase large subunit
LQKHGLPVTRINKVTEGSPHIVESIEQDRVQFIVNTVIGEQKTRDSFSLRRSSLNNNRPYCTTIAGGLALIEALKSLKDQDITIKPLQEYLNISSE